MDVNGPHKVGRLMQLIQHRENEYKSERVNRRGFEDYEIICEIIYIYIRIFRLVLILVRCAYTYGSNT